MAELNTGDGGGKKGSKKVRSKKSNSKVDLTAMVDLAFLLITFFMLTTSLSKPQSMDLGLPDKKKDPNEKEDDIKVDQVRTVTIILGKDNKISRGKSLLWERTALYAFRQVLSQHASFRYKCFKDYVTTETGK